MGSFFVLSAGRGGKGFINRPLFSSSLPPPFLPPPPLVFYTNQTYFDMCIFWEKAAKNLHPHDTLGMPRQANIVCFVFMCILLIRKMKMKNRNNPWAYSLRVLFGVDVK
jgi:hypothetical protein